MTTYIYHLLDRGRVYYVGKSRNPASRLYGHLSPRSSSRAPVVVWMRSVLAKGRKPKLRIVRRCRGDGLAQERREIARAVAKGWPVVNVFGNLRRQPPSQSKWLRCDRINALRVKRGMNIRMAAKAGGLDPCQWCDIERGINTNICITTLNKLGRALRVDVRELLMKPRKAKR